MSDEPSEVKKLATVLVEQLKPVYSFYYEKCNATISDESLVLGMLGQILDSLKEIRSKC